MSISCGKTLPARLLLYRLYAIVRQFAEREHAAPRSGAARAPGARGGGGGGRQRNRENHQAPSPNAAYFLVLGRGWPVFGLPPWKKFSGGGLAIISFRPGG